MICTILWGIIIILLPFSKLILNFFFWAANFFDTVLQNLQQLFSLFCNIKQQLKCPQTFTDLSTYFFLLLLSNKFAGYFLTLGPPTYNSNKLIFKKIFSCSSVELIALGKSLIVKKKIILRNIFYSHIFFD